MSGVPGSRIGYARKAKQMGVLQHIRFSNEAAMIFASENRDASDMAMLEQSETALQLRWIDTTGS